VALVNLLHLEPGLVEVAERVGYRLLGVSSFADHSPTIPQLLTDVNTIGKWGATGTG
jgi:hypothetical protein